MKKLAALSILLTLITAAAFAQFKVDFSASFKGDLVSTARGVDNQASQTGTRWFDILSSRNWDGPGLGLTIKYNEPRKDDNGKDIPRYGAKLALSLDWLWDELISAGSTNKTVNSQLGLRDGKASVMDIFSSTFGDWNVWGQVGEVVVLKGFFGNTDNRGATAGARGDEYTDWYKNALGTLGIMQLTGVTGATKPADPNTGKLVMTVKDIDVSDLRSGLGTDTSGKDHGSTYASIEAKIAPLTIAVATDLSGLAAHANLLNKPVPENTFDTHTGIGGAFRVSGDLELLKFDAIYKITGGDPITEANATSPATLQNGGEGHWYHRFGLYGNVNLLEVIGLTVGYSGMTETQENTSERNITHTYPYYSGVDLRLSFKASDTLGIFFNNNISFALIEGKNTVNNIGTVHGFTNNNINIANTSEGYFGMHNAIIAKLKMSPELETGFTIGNRWYSYTYTDESKTVLTTDNWKEEGNYDVFNIAASVAYKLPDHVTLGTGLGFQFEHSTLHYITRNEKDTKSGLMTFSIPVKVVVEF